MDNYNVDDILSEIKQRKSRQKGAAPEPRPPVSEGPSPSDGFRFEPVPEAPAGQPVRPASRPAQPPAAQSRPGAAPPPAAAPTGRPAQRPPQQKPAPQRPVQPQFTFQPPDEAPPAAQRRPAQGAAPAAARPQRPAQAPPAFRPPAGAPQATRPPVARPASGTSTFAPPAQRKERDIDFSLFRPPEEDLGEGTAPPREQESTRVLPGFENAPRHNIEREYYEEGYEEDELSSSIDFSEYNSVEDRHDVATDIARVKLWLFIRTAATALLALVLLYLGMAGRYAWPIPAAIDPIQKAAGYLMACTVVTAVLACVNSATIGGGILSLLKMRANSDTLATLALLATVGQGVAGIINPADVVPDDLSLYFPVAAAAMLFNALGKMTMINRIQTNFWLLATDKRKRAVQAVEDDAFCSEFVPEATRRPTIAYSVQADFFNDFLGLSYSDKYDVGINRAVAPVCLLGAIIVGVVSFLLGKNAYTAISAYTAVLCVCAAFSSTFVENIPLRKLTRKLAPEGAMVSGNKAVEDFCDTAAIVLSENDLFPAGHVRLRGIRTFSQARIDEAIVDAASVMCELGGALSPLFLQVIGGDRRLLRKVDNVVYENGMGVSAWVAQRRVLIGNRLLMQNHGILLPPDAVSTRVPEDSDVLYLATSGEAAAQFAVSYSIDENLAQQLDLLAVHDKQLIIYTTDAHITPARIYEMYGYPEDLISVLPAERHQQFRQMTEPRENAVAEIVYTGRAPAMVGAILACINARSSILSATILELIQIVLGYGLIAFLAFMGAVASLSILQMLLYQVFWFAVILITQSVRQA